MISKYLVNGILSTRTKFLPFLNSVEEERVFENTCIWNDQSAVLEI